MKSAAILRRNVKLPPPSPQTNPHVLRGGARGYVSYIGGWVRESLAVKTDSWLPGHQEFMPAVFIPQSTDLK